MSKHFKRTHRWSRKSKPAKDHPWRSYREFANEPEKEQEKQEENCDKDML